MRRRSPVGTGEREDGLRRQVPALRMGCQDFVELRRGNHRGARLNLEQQRLAEEREKSEDEVIEYFKQWANNANVRAAICGDCASPEERQRRIMEIFGRVASVPGPEPAIPNQDQTDGT